MTLVKPEYTFHALDMKDHVGRKARAKEHMLSVNNVSRRFGYWKSPKTPNDPELTSIRMYAEYQDAQINTLEEIEKYAGYITYPRSMNCLKCGGRCKVGAHEFVFKPLGSGFLYRWPDGLMHYFRYHHAQIPDWMPELVSDFNLAREQGFWK